MAQVALVVIGSRTSENGYGVESGLRVAAALRSRGWRTEVVHAEDGRNILHHLVDTIPDVVIPVGFGPPCEDGHIFAAARLAGIPCAGPTPLVGSLAQDKTAFSRTVDAIFAPGSGVRSPRGFSVTAEMSPANRLQRAALLRTPLLIKPNYSGSSEGLFVTSDVREALSFVEMLLHVEGKVLVQELERNVRHEISITILDTLEGPRFLPIVELRRDDVDVLGASEKFGSEGQDRHIIPARLGPSLLAKVRNVALAIRRELGPIGLSRIDALVLEGDEIVVLELNSVPGLLESSIACDAAAAAGLDFADLAAAYAATAHLDRPEPRIWETRP